MSGRGVGGVELRHPERPPTTEFVRRRKVVHRVSSSLLGPVDPSLRALYGRLKFTVRRHKFNKDSLSFRDEGVNHFSVAKPDASHRTGPSSRPASRKVGSGGAGSLM